MRPALVLLLALAACQPALPPIDAARLPPNAFGPGDQDLAAVQLAREDFADASRTYGNPAAGAEAVLAMDYLAGALSTAPRWAYLPGDLRLELLQARLQTRQAVGIAPGAPSQLVVTSLLAARRALLSGDKPAASAALATPAFTLPPQQTLERLGNLPYIQAASTAAIHAAEATASPNDPTSLND